MDQAEIQQLFQDFAAPLSSFVALGGDRDAATQLARNLWAAMLAGGDVEADFWQTLEQSGSELTSALRRCYEDDMCPQISAEQLAELRRHYQIEPPESTGSPEPDPPPSASA